MADSLAAFRAEMQRRGVYERNEPRLLSRAERSARNAKRRANQPIDISALSIKQLAFRFGVAKPDSEMESDLYRALVEKVRGILEARVQEAKP